MRRAAAVLFGILLGLFVLEGTLQALAYMTLRRAREEQRPESERAQTFSGRRVLCVGDSYTYGIGAKSRKGSYPARLEEYLQADGEPDRWIVVNEGWPSRNSQELNDLLPGLLPKYKPDWVVVLIGINDRWTVANPADTTEASPAANPDAWTWKWRTKRFFEIAWANLRGNGETARIAPDSANVRAMTDSVPAPAATDSAALPDLVSSPTVEGEDVSSVADAAIPAGSDTVSVLRLRLRQTLASNTSKVATQEQRKEVYDIAEEARRLGSEELAIDVVEAYSRLKMHTFAVEEGLSAMKRYGESARLARVLVHPLQRTQRQEDALRHAERSVELDSLDAENWRVLAAARFQIPDPQAGLHALLQFQKQGGSDTVLTRHFRAHNLATTISTEELETAIRDAGIDEEHANQVRQLFGTMSNATGTEAALLSHLRGIAARIRESGARPLFLNYPTPGAQTPAAQNQSIAEVAARESIPFLDLRTLLEKESAGRPREEFFILDGHCTDRGYDIVAKAIAAKLLELDRAAGPSS